MARDLFGKHIQRLMMRSLSQEARYALERKQLHLNLQPPANLTFRLATSQQELESAFRLVHNSEVRSGRMKPHPSGLKVTKWHALPSTSTLIALWDNQVVATASIHRRNSFGLPLEKIFDISALVTGGTRLTEISSLALHSGFTDKKSEVLFPFYKFIFNYSQRYFGTTHFAIAVPTEQFAFYEGIFLFKPLAKDTPLVSTTAGQMRGGILDLNEVTLEGRRLYGKALPEQNLYHYIFEAEFANFQFPVRDLPKISDPVLSPDLVDYFFNDRTKLFSELNENDISFLHQQYPALEFRRILPRLPKKRENPIHDRNELRFEVQCRGTLISENGSETPVDLVDISMNGVQLLTPAGVSKSQMYTFKIQTEEAGPLELKLMPKWSSPHKGYAGFEVTEYSAGWPHFISRFESDLFRPAVA